MKGSALCVQTTVLYSLHAALYACMDRVHGIHPLTLVLFRHANVALVGDIVESLLEEIKVPFVVCFVVASMTMTSFT